MQALVDFIEKHTRRYARDNKTKGGIDVGFFKVLVVDEPKVEEFTRIVADNHDGCFGISCSPFDTQPRNYMELGGWIGDQGLAMHFMALAVHLKLGELTLIADFPVFQTVASRD